MYRPRFSPLLTTLIEVTCAELHGLVLVFAPKTYELDPIGPTHVYLVQELVDDLHPFLIVLGQCFPKWWSADRCRSASPH